MLPFVEVTHPEIPLLRVLLPANLAGERLLARVRDQVPLHGGHADEPLAAHAAHREDLGGTLLGACRGKRKEKCFIAIF